MVAIGFACVVCHVSCAIYDCYMCHNSYRCHCLLLKLSSEIMVSWSTCTSTYNVLLCACIVWKNSGPEVRMLLVQLHVMACTYNMKKYYRTILYTHEISIEVPSELVPKLSAFQHAALKRA